MSGHSLAVPGYMVWCALIYAGAASWLSWIIGCPLVQLNAARYAQEAELRFALVRLNEHIDSVSLCGGSSTISARHRQGHAVSGNRGFMAVGPGRVVLPSPDRVMIIPRHPHMPLGTLRAALAYPSAETAFKDEELLASLRSSRLESSFLLARPNRALGQRARR
jgi:ABC-type uncharacterized transport system fused permease/ATPase subunit